MALLTRLTQRRHTGPEAFLLALSVLSSTAAQAQIAEVVRPDAQGDFATINIRGDRAIFQQRFWLVVDRDPRGLLCRDLHGRAWIALRYGAVLELDQAEQQSSQQLIQGKPYLRMAIKPVDLLYDARFQGRGQSSVCFVRANSAFLPPIHPDSLEQIRLRP
jgi:hypothetical protein